MTVLVICYTTIFIFPQTRTDRRDFIRLEIHGIKKLKKVSQLLHMPL
jgi:hypothetical protein